MVSYVMLLHSQCSLLQKKTEYSGLREYFSSYVSILVLSFFLWLLLNSLFSSMFDLIVLMNITKGNLKKKNITKGFVNRGIIDKKKTTGVRRRLSQAAKEARNIRNQRSA